MVIWALYDDAEMCYKKYIEKHFKDIQVLSIGLNDNQVDKYYKIDLSLNNRRLIQELSILPKPDIILASPPCESWSGADCGGRLIVSVDKDSITLHHKKYYEEYNKNAHPVKRREFIQKEKSRLVGEATVGGVIEIIEHFKPKIWVIENPKTSKTWKYQKYYWNFGGIENDATYSAYNENFSLKPTIFKSNVELNLKKDRIVGNKNHMNSSYKKKKWNTRRINYWYDKSNFSKI